jgi:uncharacterized membrane protein YoaK (UPF0700 family)
LFEYAVIRHRCGSLLISYLRIQTILMFRHGKPRGFLHNLRLASMLSLVAGMVNIIGVLSINTLTTNVTGHFAFFAEEFSGQRYRQATTFVIFILFFLLGAFVSGFFVELVSRRKLSLSHALPMFIEVSILTVVALSGEGAKPIVIACALLFAMGLQNALVTKISKATVRTTHLTGLFTDLGIELSQLFFYRQKEESVRLNRSIFLRLMIILFFFLGGLSGGYLYNVFKLHGLLFAAVALVVALLYDNIRFSFLYYFRKIFRG